MRVVNLSDSWIHLDLGYSLPPNDPVEIKASIYSGNATLKQQLESLFDQGRIYVGPPDVPGRLSDVEHDEETGKESDTVHLYDRDVTVSGDTNGYATLSVEENLDDAREYGRLDLASESGSSVRVDSYAKSSSESMISARKQPQEAGSLLELLNGTNTVMKVGPTEAVGFFGVTPAAQQTLNPATATTTQIVNALIALGLAKAP